MADVTERQYCIWQPAIFHYATVRGPLPEPVTCNHPECAYPTVPLTVINPKRG